MFRNFIRFGAAAAALASALPAQAATIVHTAVGRASGTLNSVFFDSSFTITSKADLSSQQTCNNGGNPIPGCKFVVNDELKLDIGGIGTVTLTGPSISFVNNGPGLFGFSELLPGAPPIVNTFAFINTGPRGSLTPVFLTWDGASNLGPVNTNGFFNRFFAPFVATSGGNLVFSPAPQDQNVVFSAVVQQGAVPEPATWAMLIAGFGLTGAAMRRTRSVRVAFTA
jgi:hypothetical protein